MSPLFVTSLVNSFEIINFYAHTSGFFFKFPLHEMINFFTSCLLYTIPVQKSYMT